jgi:hypothetical protein
VVAVSVRPAEAERPEVVRRPRRAEPPRRGPRLLVRPMSRPIREGGRRILAGLGVTVVTAAAVVGLGLLAGTASHEGAGDATAEPATVTVTVEPTVWEVAQRVAPAASGPELAAVAERIVTDNALDTVRLHPGQVLRVMAG